MTDICVSIPICKVTLISENEYFPINIHKENRSSSDNMEFNEINLRFGKGFYLMTDKGYFSSFVIDR